jgi:hypothetical protein
MGLVINPNNTTSSYTFSSVCLSHQKQQDVSGAGIGKTVTTTTTLTPSNRLFLQSRYNVISTSVRRIPKALIR